MAQMVTVFGGSGFVGKQVVRALARLGWRIRVAVHGADACINLVGVRHQTMGTSFDAVHRAAATRMAEICAAKGIRDFVQVSALGADPKAPSQYSATKAKGEDGVKKAIPQAVILRPGPIFGPQ